MRDRVQGASREVLADRQRWPAAVLRGVLEDLIAVTPRDLLARYSPLDVLQ